MSAARLYVLDELAGTEVARLQLVTAETVEQLDLNDALTARVVLDANAAALTQRTPLRLYGGDGTVREYRVSRIAEDFGNEWVDITGEAPWLGVAVAGLVRVAASDGVTFSVGGRLTATEWLTDYFVPNLAADGLDWISSTLGTIDSSQLVTLEFERWNRAQLVQAIATALELEVYLSQSAVGAAYQLNMVAERGAALPTFTIAQQKNAPTLSREQADTDLRTIAAPFGDVPDGASEPATIAENVWLATAVDSEWLALTDPSGGLDPIAFDDMCIGAYVEAIIAGTPTRTAVLDSRAVDSAVKVAATGAYAGLLVRLAADSTGTPLFQLSNPAAVALYGAVVQPLSVAGGRGERNWVKNPILNNGATNWNAIGSGWLSVLPVSENADVAGLKNGTGSVASTSLAVDGFPAGYVVQRGTMITSGSNQLFCNAATTLDGSGAGTIPLFAGITSTIADNAVVTILRNQYGWEGASNNTSVLRAAGGLLSDTFYVDVRGPVARTVQFQVQASIWLAVANIWYGEALTIPVLLEVLDGSSVVIGSDAADIEKPIETDARPAPVSFTLKVPVELAGTALCQLRITCASASITAPFVAFVVEGASATIGSDENVPISADSHANHLWQEAIRYLALHELATPALNCTLVDLALMVGAQRLPLSIALGQSAYIRDYDATQRLVRVARNQLFPEVAQLQFARLPKTAAQLLTGTGFANVGVVGPRGEKGNDGEDGAVGATGPAGADASGDTTEVTPLPSIIPFNSYRGGPFTVAAVPSARTALQAGMIEAFDCTNATTIRLQAYVATALASARLALEFYNSGAAAWQRVGVYGGPFLSLTSTGYIRGTSEPITAAALADVMLRVVSLDGDAASAVEIGNLSALIYVGPLLAAIVTSTGCAIPAGIESSDFSDYATAQAFLDFVDGGTGLYGLFWDISRGGFGGDDRRYLVSGQPLVKFDTAKMFHGHPGLKAPYHVDLDDNGQQVLGFPIYSRMGDVDGNHVLTYDTDMTIARVFEIEAGFDVHGVDPTVSYLSGLVLMECGIKSAVVNHYDYVQVSLRNGGIYMDRYAYGVSPVAGILLTYVADWTGRPIQTLLRVERLTGTSYRLSIYLDEACPTTPTLLYQQTYTGTITDPSMIEVQYDQWYMGNTDVGDGVSGTEQNMWIYQMSFDTDASSYGL